MKYQLNLQKMAFYSFIIWISIWVIASDNPHLSKVIFEFFHLTLVFYIFGSYLNPSCHTSDWLSKCYHRNWDRDMKILCSTFVLTRSTGRRKYHKVKWNENEPRNIGECRNWFVLIDVHCRHFCPNSHFDRIIILLK